MTTERLSDRIADILLSMITIEKRFAPGDKFPNELELANELAVSRTTIREAIRILITRGIVEIKRGKGTFVKPDLQIDESGEFHVLTKTTTNLKDLYEMRLIVEPEAARLAALRASEEEIAHIVSLGEKIEQHIEKKQDRTSAERAFHKAIAKATHNEFMNKLMPVIYESIDKGVLLSDVKTKAVEATLQDHRLIMEFLKCRNCEGAKDAMRIHILHAIQDLEL